MPIIDIHAHGIGDYDTKGATPEDILRIAEIHGSHGVDAIIPTIYSASINQMRLDIAAVKKAMETQREDGRLKREDGSKKVLKPETCSLKPATILGVHLEGPFLSPARAGALDRNSFLPAKISKCKQLLEGFGDVVKIITVAPELDGAADLIRSITDTGIIVSMGHSDATYSEAETGFNAGAKGITHIFNAMRGIHHREPGIAGFGLTNPHVCIEVIADPFHLHPKTIELIFGMKKPDKIIIVSDSVKEAQMDNGAHGVTDPTNRLLGGSMTITESAKYLIGLGFEKNIVERCIGANPAKYLTNGPSSVNMP
jgi:N-acetylglucosamine-6-phosphate deacetylase